MRVALIDTTAPAAAGSMSRYRDLVARAVGTVAPEISVHAIPLALPASLGAMRPRVAVRWINHAWMAVVCRRLARQHWDLFHIPDGSYAFLAAALPAHRTVITVHDLIPWLQMQGRFPGAPSPSRPARALIAAGLRQLHGAAWLVVSSESTRADALGAGVPSARMTVVPLAIDAQAWSRLQSDDEHMPFELLHVGHAGFYKNRVTALQVLALLAPEGPWRLTLAGDPLTAAEREFLDTHGLAPRVAVRRGLSDAALARLYRTACVLLFPSLYEGFGWPPLEAMACGCPVVCSNAASLPEITGDAAFLANPMDAAAMAAHCRRLASDPALREQAGQRGLRNVRRFTLESMGRGLVGAYREAMAAREGCPS